MDARVEEILGFWFGRPGEPEHGKARKVWFKRDAEFDAEIAARFRALHDEARAGRLDHWRAEARSCLALVLLLDQVPRNLFRDSARAFASDAQALALAREAVDRGLDAELSPLERGFLYMPFQHSEALDDQRRSLELFAALADDAEAGGTYEFAERHHAVIARFGRFPHRNAVLGRATTAEEAAFLADNERGF